MPRVDRELATAEHVTVWTDGSMYYRHPIRAGGWAYVIADRGEVVMQESEAELLTTVNRMELTAVVRALEASPGIVGNRQVFLYSDSQYVVRGATEWLPYWKLNGWQAATGGPVKNRDLWEMLDAAKLRVDLQWGWVRGHTGVEYNDLADELAGQAAKGAMEAWRTSRKATL